MIARILILVVVFTLLPYLWIYKRYGKLWLKSLWQRVLFWLPAFVVIAYSAYITMLPNFLPRNPVLIDIWFVIMAVCAVPQFVFSLFSVFGWCCMRLLHGHRNWGKLLGLVVGAVAFFCFIYGFTEGFPKMQVKRITIYVPNLPKSFEGYRIVQFSDIHLGSYYGWRGHLPQRDIDSINAEKPDLICFTGDLQNVTPDELPEYQALLSSLKARDGVMSVLGNHDYTYYMDVDDEQEIAALEKRMQDFQRSCGWRLLMNEHVAVHRGADSIFVAGTENYDKPKRTNVRKALYGIRPGSFVLMLQHIPKQWRETWPSTINKEKDVLHRFHLPARSLQCGAAGIHAKRKVPGEYERENGPWVHLDRLGCPYLGQAPSGTPAKPATLYCYRRSGRRSVRHEASRRRKGSERRRSVEKGEDGLADIRGRYGDPETHARGRPGRFRNPEAHARGRPGRFRNPEAHTRGRPGRFRNPEAHA